MREIDDTFIVLEPGDDYEQLVEAGLISLAVKGAQKVRQLAIDAKAWLSKKRYQRARRRSTTKASTEFDAFAQRLHGDLLGSTRAYQEGKVTYGVWTKAMQERLRKAYRQAFVLGIESAGTAIAYDKRGITKLTSEDEKIIESAVRKELTYFRKLLEQIREASWRGKLEQRLSAYVETLRHMYYTGRVLGSPSDMIIDWVAPMDRRTCDSCRYLHRKSPYTKRRLPTTPRAGSTLCLSNCRCKLVMRQVSKREITQLERKLESRERMQRRLQSIKARRS